MKSSMKKKNMNMKLKDSAKKTMNFKRKEHLLSDQKKTDFESHP